MHDTAYQIGGLVMDTYLPATVPVRILEIGAQNVNGTLRDHAPRGAEYVGIDFEAGDGVDVVVTGLDDWNVPDAHFDIVMASSVFEHDKAFWLTFLVMCAKAKPGGHIYISAPSNGTIHRYPMDYWRFYPDSGLALEEWAKSQGIDVVLVESFVAEREKDVWNDYCAVFRKGPSEAPLNREYVYEKVRSKNALTWRSSQILNPADDSEDTRLLWAAHAETQRWRDHNTHVMGQFAEREAAWTEERTRLSSAIDHYVGRIATLDEAAAATSDQSAQLQARAEALQRDLDTVTAEMEALAHERDAHTAELEGRLSALQSRLAQRDEETVQAWSSAEQNARERDALRAEIETVKTELGEANGWVSRLAMTRTQLERRVVALDKALAKLGRDYADVQRINEGLVERVAGLVDQQRPVRSAANAPSAGHTSKDLRSQQEAPSAPAGSATGDDAEAGNRISSAAYDSVKEALAETRIKLRKAIDDLASDRARHDDHATLLQTATEDLAHVRAQLDESWQDAASLGAMVASGQDRIVELERQNRWLREAGRFLLSPGKWWWRFMPRQWQQRKREKRLLRNGLFDSAAYLAANPDVVESGEEPFLHYLYHGIAENRRFD